MLARTEHSSEAYWNFMLLVLPPFPCADNYMLLVGGFCQDLSSQIIVFVSSGSYLDTRSLAEHRSLAGDSQLHRGEGDKEHSVHSVQLGSSPG